MQRGVTETHTWAGRLIHASWDSPETIREGLIEQFNVDHPILDTISGCTRLSDSDFAAGLMPANNNVMLDKFLDSSEFIGLGVVTPQIPHRAAEEIGRIGSEKQIVGLFLETFAQDPPIGDPMVDPLLKQRKKMLTDTPAAAFGLSV